jgi:hypothetical protein
MKNIKVFAASWHLYFPEIYFPLENEVDDSAYMKKLNQKKVRWIMRKMKKGGNPVHIG